MILVYVGEACTGNDISGLKKDSNGTNGIHIYVMWLYDFHRNLMSFIHLPKSFPTGLMT